MKIKIKSKEILILHCIVVINVVTGKIFFNEGSANSASATSSIAAYVIACVFFASFGLIFFIADKTRLPKQKMLIISLIYYLWMLIWSWNSKIPIMSVYYSVSGILMCIFCVLYARVNSAFNEAERLKNVTTLILLVFLSYFISSVFFEWFYRGKLITSGIPIGFGAVLYYFLIFYYTKVLIDQYKVRYVPVVILLVFLGLFLKSFTAFLSYLICMAVYLFYKRRFIVLSIIGMMVGVIAMYFLAYIFEHEGGDFYIAGKSVNSIITGSGRFSVYYSAIDAYTNLNIVDKIKGVGFMAERAALKEYDLAWSTDVHNSFLLSTLTGGIIGSLLYVLYVIYPFFSKGLKSSDNYPLYISFHSMCVFFGLSSSYYLGRPSYLFLISIVFFSAIYNSGKVRS